jgi:lactate permease
LIADTGGDMTFGAWGGVIAADRRLQVLLVAFCFGAFLEGTAGPVAAVGIPAAILAGLGLPPLVAAGVTLVANTVAAAFGALATPIQGLHDVTGLGAAHLGVRTGQLLFVFSVLVPFWLIMLLAGFRRMLEVWPAAAVTGLSFALAQLVTATHVRPAVVDLIAAIFSAACLLGFLHIWQPAPILDGIPGKGAGPVAPAIIAGQNDARDIPPGRRSWVPWGGLAVMLWIWEQAPIQQALNAIWAPALAIPGLDKLVVSTPPAVFNQTAEEAVYRFNILSMPGTAILVSALLAAVVLECRPRQLLFQFGATLKLGRYPLAALASITAMAFVIRYSGQGATLALVFAGTGRLYPFFAALLGWLGVVLTGSVASSNVLFGGLQAMGAHALGMRPDVMVATLGTGAAMGGPVAAQNVVVASTITQRYGQAGCLLRYVFLHSIVLAVLVGVEAFLQG